ncbi:hypothetical protein BKA93DRAFT_755745 [Sparassis latifolia]
MTVPVSPTQPSVECYPPARLIWLLPNLTLFLLVHSYSIIALTHTLPCTYIYSSPTAPHVTLQPILSSHSRFRYPLHTGTLRLQALSEVWTPQAGRAWSTLHPYTQIHVPTARRAVGHCLRLFT